MGTTHITNEAADTYARRLSEATDLDPVSVIPRGVGFIAVEGMRGGRLAVRAIFHPSGALFGAWDPEHFTDTCAHCGSRPNIKCCEFGRGR